MKEENIIMNCAPGAIIKIDGKEFSYFGGTSYFELHKNPLLLNASIEALNQYGISSASSRSGYGTTDLLIKVEEAAAKYFGCESSVYLPSGFLTDSAAIQTFTEKEMFDVIFIDEISHYSNVNAAKLSGKSVITFSHVDSNDLKNKLEENLTTGQIPLVITDGIFPIYGKIAPINEYLKIVEKYNGLIWIDDAHALGILGENGRGTKEHFNLNSKSVYFGGTLSKAFGAYGGIIPGDSEFIDSIKNSGLVNGATPPISAACAASLMGIKILSENYDLRNKLHQNAKYLKTGLKSIGIEVENSSVPIAAWSLKNKDEMKKIQNELLKNNIIIQFMNYIGSGDSGVLRVVVFSTHTLEQIDNLIDELKKHL